MANGKVGRPARHPSITEDMIKRIEAREFDFRLPTTRETIKHYRASSRTIDQVWEALKAKGYTITRPGVGTYIKKRS